MRHLFDIRKETNRGATPMYQARCTCGWEGPQRWTQDQAESDCENHEYDEDDRKTVDVSGIPLE